MSRPAVKAVFFDVDFTLIHPGPTFQGVGYERFCARHGIVADPNRFQSAVRAAAAILDEGHDHIYDPAVFVRYTRRIIEGMGGVGDRLDACAEEIYAEWAACEHFEMYDDVLPTLQVLAGRGIRVGLISNAHRCLDAFQEHFQLVGLIAGAVSSSAHGYLKPHPSIFHSALALLGVHAGESVMVGDSPSHDVDGARRVGMHGVLVERDPRGTGASVADDVPVIHDLLALPSLLS